MIEEIIFGNLPLLGITYQGKMKDEECRRRFVDKQEVMKIIEVALRYNIRLFAASSTDFNELAPTYLEAVQEIAGGEATDIRLIPCIGLPLELAKNELNDYRRWATHLYFESRSFGNVKEKYVKDPILNCRPAWKNTLIGAKPYDLNDLEKGLRLNWRKWEERLSNFSELKCAWIELGSESDLLAISRMDLLEELVDKLRGANHQVLLGTHHAGTSIPLIEDKKVKISGYVTPINKQGIMMFPTKLEAEKAIERASYTGKLVIGIKPLAGGRIEPKEALAYVYNESKANACMIGVSSVEEAKEDFQIAREILGK